MRDIINLNGVEYEREEYLQKFTRDDRINNYKKREIKDYKIYDKKDFEKIGRPDRELGLKYLEYNGERYELYNGFYGEFSQYETKDWFGKVALVRCGGEYDNNVNVLNLETGEMTFLSEIPRHSEYNITPITENYFKCDTNTFRSFITSKDGIILDSVEGLYRVNNNQGHEIKIEKAVGYGIVNLETVETFTVEDLDKKLALIKAQEKFQQALEEMKELGLSEQNIKAIVENAYEKEETRVQSK